MEKKLAKPIDIHDILGERLVEIERNTNIPQSCLSRSAAGKTGLSLNYVITFIEYIEHKELGTPFTKPEKVVSTQKPIIPREKLEEKIQQKLRAGNNKEIWSAIFKWFHNQKITEKIDPEAALGRTFSQIRIDTKLNQGIVARWFDGLGCPSYGNLCEFVKYVELLEKSPGHGLKSAPELPISAEEHGRRIITPYKQDPAKVILIHSGDSLSEVLKERSLAAGLEESWKRHLQGKARERFNIMKKPECWAK